MKELLRNEMLKDIEKCERNQDNKNGSYKLFQQLVSKYCSYDKNFTEGLVHNGHVAVSGEFDYRPELNNVKSKLEMYLIQDPIEINITTEEQRVSSYIDLYRNIINKLITEDEIIKNTYIDSVSFFSTRINEFGIGCYSYFIEHKIFDTNIEIETIIYNMRVLLPKIEDYFDKKYNKPKQMKENTNNNLSNIKLIQKIFSKFDEAADVMTKRRKGKDNLIIDDEYDVQDFMEMFLQLEFDDVRPEEWTPSFAGSSTRQDFLLKKEKIVVETKKTRTSMTNKSLRDELIIDIENYTVHPDCEHICIFVYDKSHIIKQYTAIKDDLESKHNNVYVHFLR